MKTNSVTPDASPLWQPDSAAAAQTAMARFAKEQGINGGYAEIWRWSVAQKETFWSALWNFCGVIGEKGDVVFQPAARFQDARFFPQGKINFAENLLRRRDDADAIVFRGENKVSRRLSHAQLYDAVSKTAQALKNAGVAKGDRVAGFLPNMPEAVIAMLATASLGAVWSSASPDFGVQGVIDRFGQIEPKVLFAVDAYWYGGKRVDCLEKIRGMQEQLPTLQKTVVVRYAGEGAGLPGDSFDDFVTPFAAGDIAFERFDFNHPLYIMFSSGTTGIPKCIVHGAGGTLLQHLKEHRLHCDIRRDDRVFYFSTCGWMMWNWLVSALASEAALMLYDGSPFFPKGYALFDFAEAERFTLFGTAAKFIDALRQNNIRVAERPGLAGVRMITSTGSPLSHEGFDYVYDAIFPNAQLASISGGTDIVSCFVLGNPLSPVYRGEIQGPGLGMDVDVFDDAARHMGEGKGELVCKTPFPSMPIGFWNDPQGEKYNAAYFSRFDGVWCHGDWCEWTPQGGLIIHGRSDATLNPGGVRIGTAEIYRVVEQIPGIRESIVVGQDWDGDVRVVLFVVLHEGVTLDDVLSKKIRDAIRAQASPRHVPAKIVPVADIPRTKSGKITELAVRDVIHGRVVKNVEALANPEALALYQDLPELQS